MTSTCKTRSILSRLAGGALSYTRSGNICCLRICFPAFCSSGVRFKTDMPPACEREVSVSQSSEGEKIVRVCAQLAILNTELHGAEGKKKRKSGIFQSCRTACMHSLYAKLKLASLLSPSGVMRRL